MEMQTPKNKKGTPTRKRKRKKKAIDYEKVKFWEHWAKSLFSLWTRPLDGYYFNTTQNGTSLMKVDRKLGGKILGYDKFSTYARITNIEMEMSLLGWLFGYKRLIVTTSSGEENKHTLNYIKKSDVAEMLAFGNNEME